MSSNTKLVLPVALGLSLVTVTAFVVYYVFKKDDEEENKNVKEVKTSRFNTIEVPVPKNIVPALIGRSGSNIKEIEKKTGASINFKKLNDADHDICVIRGRSETTQLAEMSIHEFVRSQPEVVEETLVVPGWSIGRIIGTRGENINDISHRSGARVKIESGSPTDNTSQRNVSVRGSEKQIAEAKKLIENCVALEKCRRESQPAKQPRHSPSPARSPAPLEEPPGDSPRPVRCKRPAESGGAPIEVYVSAVSSPSRFWVQFVGPQVTQLDELVAHMTEYYGNKDNRAAHALSHVSVGQVVAAVFRHDGRWYRARVDNIQPNEFDATQKVADVFYLDYGDSEYVATHELCELRADLLRLRFQAMECFLAGVRAARRGEGAGEGPREEDAPEGALWDRWHPQAIERFEELTQVARWKPLASRTCSYRQSAAAEGGKETEIPGIKLFDVSDEGEIDIGATLIAEKWAECGAPLAPPPAQRPPFGDLGNSRVLGMLAGPALPPPPRRDQPANHEATGLEDSAKVTVSDPITKHNGSHEDFDRLESDPDSTPTPTPLSPKLREEFKANMNRIDSHHSNLEALGRSQQDLHK